MQSIGKLILNRKRFEYLVIFITFITQDKLHTSINVEDIKIFFKEVV